MEKLRNSFGQLEKEKELDDFLERLKNFQLKVYACAF